MDKQGRSCNRVRGVQGCVAGLNSSLSAIPTNRAIELVPWRFAVGMVTACQLIDTSDPALNISATLHHLILF